MEITRQDRQTDIFDVIHSQHAYDTEHARTLNHEMSFDASWQCYLIPMHFTVIF